ncbi:hypothetical protein SAMN05443665_100533 [Actinomadura meyerae]|uniref:Uncharacterized protein n=1 Tax=Actinomadura meyerae TaxID=240840 RepID=A0A239EW19_9ACTN|nr:hypothetical protein [Actinomadura meyerae]SNS48960.1 hypothetical protein SAMN05443665_100533 [Actinomadura meyerae]
MFDPSPTIGQLRTLRRHRPPRREAHRFLTRADFDRMALAAVPAAQPPRTRRVRSLAWTLYWRCQWALATARADRSRRRVLRSAGDGAR